MSSLKERLIRLGDSFDHPENERIERLSNYLLRSTNASIYDDSGSPTLRKAATDAVPQSFHGTDEASAGALATSKSNGRSITANAVRYVAAATLLCAAGFSFVMPTHQTQRRPSAAPRDPAIIAAISSPSSDATPYVEEAAGLQLTLPGGESWQKTLENLRLLTMQRASKAASQSESKRVLAKLEAWMKAKAP